MTATPATLGLHSAERVDKYRKMGSWTDETIDDLFREQVQTRPTSLAVVDPLNRVSLDGQEPRRLTWEEIDSEVTWLAARFLESGLGHGSVIGMQLPNTVELVAVYLAAWSIGAAVSPLAMPYREREFVHMASTAQFDAMITGLSFGKRHIAAEIAAARSQVPSIKTQFCIQSTPSAADTPGLNLPEVTYLHAAVATEADKAALAAHRQTYSQDPNDCATICWTSGTTGTPKGVLRAHYDWLNFSWAVIDAVDNAGSRSDGTETELGPMGAEEVLLNPFPMINMAGINGMLLPWLRTGGRLVQHHPFDPNTFFAQIQQEKVTFTIVPPALLLMLLHNEALLSQVDLSSLKRLGSGSAPLQPAMMEGWEKKFGLHVINFFGSNEGAGLLSNARDMPNATDRARYFPRYGAPGIDWSSRISKWVHTKIVDMATGEEIHEPGRPGELWLDGPQLCAGYVKGEELENPFTPEGYLRTGDVFEIAGERNQYLLYVDRAKDLVIRGGMNISPVEIESLISEHPAVADVAVVGDPDEILGERVAAVVSLRPDTSLTLEEIVEFLRNKKIASFKLPERLEIREELPRNPVGKLLKRELRKPVSPQK